MKKIFFTLLALVGTMSMNAQVVKLYKGDVLVTSYDASQVDNVVFEEAPVATTGTAKATIGSSEVDVNCVQLWENGPKFAEFNVGASSVTETGTTMTFADAIKTGSYYVWGANWQTPSKDQMDELLKAATSGGSTKVVCNYIQENGVYGFKFTGKETGYTDNSVFFPAQEVNSSRGDAYYWSATANGSEAWVMYLYCINGGSWYSNWYPRDQDYDYLVRPVLKN